jgi:hypothetical protein
MYNNKGKDQPIRSQDQRYKIKSQLNDGQGESKAKIQPISTQKH